MKRKIVSMLLALALVVTGIPSGMTADTTYAAEVSKDSAVLSDEAEETDSAMESTDASQEALHSEAGDLYAFNVTEDGKAVGSDGVAYDDVVYLSAANVNALGAEGQDAYVEICDRIAEDKKAGDYIQNAVIAVDENGNLFLQREVPMEVFQDSMEKLAEGFSENVTVFQEDEEEDKEVQQPAEEEEKLPVETSIETEIEVEDETEEANFEDADSENESIENTDSKEDTEEAVEEESKAEASVDETIPMDTEETSTEEDLAEIDSEESSTQESDADEVSATEEASTEEENESATEDVFVLTAENMELVGGYETEEFEVVENAKADILVDLGYNNVGDVSQLYSILPQDDWFSSQLSESQKPIYNACKVLGKGTNTFTISQSTPPEVWDIYQAVSAYIMTEPYKCDWMDTTQNTKIFDYYLVDASGKGTYNKKTTVTLPKSKYYTAAIQKEANAKVLELAAEAQEYAIEYYPDSPVFGIVEYFDAWICGNNYYSPQGLLTESDIVIKDGIAEIVLPEEKKAPYYYCHSSYGILLKGYGVCESYALAMTRLLDAVGIPNMYASGQALDENGNRLGGHAWNYIQMPNGNWYLQDSTWNDDEDVSLGYWLLSGDDGLHEPIGNRFIYYTKAFDFVPRSSSYYQIENEKILLSATELNLLPKKTAELSYSSEYISNENIPKVWSSSNEKVVKVDKNGKVTAVAAGSAEITLTAAGMTSVCKVNVHQINSITFVEGAKASLTTSCGIVSGSNTAETQHIYLTVNQKAENPVYTAEQLNQMGVFEDFAVQSSNEKVATVSGTLTGDQIDLAVIPVAAGKAKITVTFGAKKATLNLSVGEMLDPNWFDLTEVEALVKDGNDGQLMYTGKAYKPKVVLSEEGKNKKVKFKVSYLNNKDAGNASVVIAGTGTYGGVLKYEFTINPLVLNVDTSSIKVTEKSVYNGGANQTKSTIKHISEAGKKVSLKAGNDYDIVYTNIVTNETTTEPKNVGTYKMEIVGKGNYAGGNQQTVEIANKTWTIDPIDIKKAKATVTINGTKPSITVAIGKNVLAETDYKITFYKDKNCTEPANAFVTKTQYFAKIEGIEGINSNVTNNAPIIKSFKTK